MERIDDKMLNKVAGGESRTHTLILRVEIPCSDAQVNMTVYKDGELYDSRFVDTSYPNCVNIAFKGAYGKIDVKVYLNDVFFKEYALDFDQLTII